MDLELTGRLALVTGASRGIGRAIARSLAAEGASVCAVSRDRQALDSLLAELGGAGHAVMALDLMEPNPGEALAAFLGDRQLDIIVNNLGGTVGVTDPFAPIEDWRAVMRQNFEVAVEINRAFLPAMREQKWGRIVNISSHAAVELNGPASYAAAKAALNAYTRCVGRLLAQDNVVMTSVMPGVVRTEDGYWEQAERDDPDRVARYLAERCPLGRFGTPEEIADVVTFLCSSRASFAPGAIWAADGGQLRGYRY